MEVVGRQQAVETDFAWTLAKGETVNFVHFMPIAFMVGFQLYLVEVVHSVLKQFYFTCL